MMFAEPLAALFIAGLTGTQMLNVREPTLPDAWVQSFEVRCGRDRLRIRGYGPHLPNRSAGPVVEWNGRPIQAAQALRRNLSNQNAAYRLSGQCLPDRGGIWLRFYLGEMTYPAERQPGEMRYSAGSATIRRGRIERYNELQPATERTFWFR
jgi:hypothetical protein